MATIYVLAGTNGAGKSSIAGEAFRAAGSDYYNPDEAASAIAARDPTLTPGQATSLAWHEGRRALEHAIATDSDFNFETTLGGRTIPALLHRAIAVGVQVRIWYAGLRTPELHLDRIRARADAGGHAISERDVRRRFDASRMNLIDLMPRLAALRVFDNSAEADPAGGARPRPELLLYMDGGRIVSHCELAATPDWAKPILMQALGRR